MHISLSQKSQIMSHLVHFAEHHKFATLLSIIVGLSLAYTLVYSFNILEYRSSGSVRYLSFLDHPPICT